MKSKNYTALRKKYIREYVQIKYLAILAPVYVNTFSITTLQYIMHTAAYRD